jgi:hypothetical protein
MHADDAYLEVLREFVALTGSDATALDLGSEVSFEFDGLLAFIFMHPLHEQVVIDVEIFQLNHPTQHPERILMLHQLNSITRFTHGAQAYVTVDNMLVLNQSLPLSCLKGQQLTDLLGQLLDKAVELRLAWPNLRVLIQAEGRSVEQQTESGTLVAANYA